MSECSAAGIEPISEEMLSQLRALAHASFALPERQKLAAACGLSPVPDQLSEIEWGPIRLAERVALYRVRGYSADGEWTDALCYSDDERKEIERDLVWIDCQCLQPISRAMIASALERQPTSSVPLQRATHKESDT